MKRLLSTLLALTMALALAPYSPDWRWKDE